MHWYGLRVYGLRVDLPAPRRDDLAGHHARGVLGRALFDTVCLYAGQRDDRACERCALNTHCAYPQVFKPVETERLAPYWLHRWELQGALLRCTWHVLEWALPHLEAWLFGLQRHGVRHYGGPLTVWDGVTGAPLVEQGRIILDRLQPLPSPPMPAGDCHFQSLTPLVSKYRDAPLYRALRTRAQRLVQHYGTGERLPVDDRPWESTVESVWPVGIPLDERVVRGRMYRVRLNDITASARELLAWGQWLHAGGQTSLGCGAYALEPLPG